MFEPLGHLCFFTEYCQSFEIVNVQSHLQSCAAVKCHKVNLAHLRGNIKCLKMFLYWWLTTVIHFLALTCSSLFGLHTEIHMPQLQCFIILKKFLHDHHGVILHCKSNRSFIPFPGLIYHIISGSTGKWW